MDLDLEFLSSKDSRDATNDAAHGQIDAVVTKEDLADARTAIVPALEQGEMFHSLERRLGLRRRECEHCLVESRFHGVRFLVVNRLYVEWHRSREAARFDAEECHRSGDAAGLNDERR